MTKITRTLRNRNTFAKFNISYEIFPADETWRCLTICIFVRFMSVTWWLATSFFFAINFIFTMNIFLVGFEQNLLTFFGGDAFFCFRTSYQTMSTNTTMNTTAIKVGRVVETCATNRLTRSVALYKNFVGRTFWWK